MPHPSPLAISQTSQTAPTPEAFRSFIEGLDRFQKYLQTDSGEELVNAEKSFSVAVDADPRFVVAKFHWAVSLAHCRKVDLAISILEELSQSKIPFEAEVHYNLAYAYFKKYEFPAFERAESELAQAQQIAKIQGNVYLEFLSRALRVLLYAAIAGRAYNRPENLEERRKKYLPTAKNEGLRLLDDPLLKKLSTSEREEVLLEAYNGLGATFMYLGDNADLFGITDTEMWERSESYYGESLAIQPKNTSVLQNLGSLGRHEASKFRQKGDVDNARRHWANAREYYLRTLAINPHDQYPHYGTSVCSVLLEEWDAASNYYKTGQAKPGAVKPEQWKRLKQAISKKNPSLLEY